jgi:hypothetical protein
MEQEILISEQNSNANFFNEQICNKCLFIFRHIVKLNSINEHTKFPNQNQNQQTKTDFLDLIKTIENYSTSNNENLICKFCLGILNEKKFNSIIESIKEKIFDIEKEHKNFKFTTNFSSLFAMQHNYVK